MAKINISIDDYLLERVDKNADTNYMSRSGYISFCIASKLKEDDLMLAVSDLAITMRRIADSNEIDEQSKKDLVFFDQLVKQFNSK